jgi:hypothetical protein
MFEYTRSRSRELNEVGTYAKMYKGEPLKLQYRRAPAKTPAAQKDRLLVDSKAQALGAVTIGTRDGFYSHRSFIVRCPRRSAPARGLLGAALANWTLGIPIQRPGTRTNILLGHCMHQPSG